MGDQDTMPTDISRLTNRLSAPCGREISIIVRKPSHFRCVLLLTALYLNNHSLLPRELRSCYSLHQSFEKLKKRCGALHPGRRFLTDAIPRSLRMAG